MKRSLITLAMSVCAATPALADLALAKTRNCMACHGVEKKIVGPSFQDVAKRYAGQSEAAAMLAGKIMQGGSGAWGPIPMPANNQVSPADANKLATWVLSLQ